MKQLTLIVSLVVLPFVGNTQDSLRIREFGTTLLTRFAAGDLEEIYATYGSVHHFKKYVEASPLADILPEDSVLAHTIYKEVHQESFAKFKKSTTDAYKEWKDAGMNGTAPHIEKLQIKKGEQLIGITLPGEIWSLLFYARQDDSYFAWSIQDLYYDAEANEYVILGDHMSFAK